MQKICVLSSFLPPSLFMTGKVLTNEIRYRCTTNIDGRIENALKGKYKATVKAVTRLRPPNDTPERHIPVQCSHSFSISPIKLYWWQKGTYPRLYSAIQHWLYRLRLGEVGWGIVLLYVGLLQYYAICAIIF